MDFIYFNFDLSLVAYLKAFAFNKNRERSAKLFFLSPLEISQHSTLPKGCPFQLSNQHQNTFSKNLIT